ncbi:protein tyrosine phosphatase family protein [Marichromatium bheemlicum]|uniref:protein tyrosine phosphatase family protein n=1 Tax=Marichromatium bheemlicum TaxID=365339 RepID=UPI0031B640D4
MDAENTHQVFDWLWTSGQLSVADIAALPRLGVDTVINLAPPTAHNALLGEAEHITALGLSYIQIPVDWEQPQVSDYQTFSVLLRALQREGRRVWVHCARNMRVSAFVGSALTDRFR